MNEIYLYNFIRSIINLSSTFQGRFAIIKGYSDLNEANFGTLIQDALGGIIDSQKYPGVVLLPPHDFGNTNLLWSTYKLTLFFCALDSDTGKNEIAIPDFGKNISTKTVVDDWSQMRQCAGDFRRAFSKVISAPGLYTGLIRPNNQNPDLYDRFSWAENDKINGVKLSFDVDLQIPCILSDYPEDIVLRYGQ